MVVVIAVVMATFNIVVMETVLIKREELELAQTIVIMVTVAVEMVSLTVTVTVTTELTCDSGSNINITIFHLAKRTLSLFAKASILIPSQFTKGMFLRT